MAICELMRDPESHRPVVINEALELARTFSTEESVKFINGMLDGVRKKIDGLKAKLGRSHPKPKRRDKPTMSSARRTDSRNGAPI